MMESSTRDLWLILLCAGAVQGYFLAFILLFNKKLSSTANKYLAFLILSICVFLTEYLLLSSSYYLYFVHLLGVSKPFFMLLGPMYFFYTVHLLGIASQYKKWNWVHYLPAAAKLAYSIPVYTMPGERKVEIVNFLMTSENLPVQWSAFIISSLPIALNVGYIVFALIKISKVQSGNGLKNGEKLKLHWLKRFNMAFVSFWILFEIVLLIITINSTYSIVLDYILALACSTFIYVLTYLSMTQSKYLTATYNDLTKKYEKSSLPGEISKSYLSRILAFMHESGAYTNPNFKLTDLASGVELSTNHVSQVLNHELGQSFHEFINQYRYEAARKMMTDPDYAHYSIQGIAEAVGFNSKSAFNRNFRKLSGKTPSEFMQVTRENKIMQP